MKYVLTLLVFLAQSPWASAEDIYLKILKSKVSGDQVDSLMNSLNRREPEMGDGFFEARVVSYRISLPELIHHGIVQVKLEDHGNSKAKARYMEWIQGQIDSGIFMPFDNFHSDLMNLPGKDCETEF